MLNKALTYSLFLVGLITLLNSTDSSSRNNQLNTNKTNPHNYSLSVSVNKIKSLRGYLHYQLLSCNPEEFNAKKQSNSDITESLVLDNLPIVFESLTKVEDSEIKIFSLNFPKGKYAIRLFQDLNDNKQLDLSSSEIPIEPVGFSNNPSIAFGAPNIVKVCFNLNIDRVIKIKLKSKLKRRRTKRQ